MFNFDFKWWHKVCIYLMLCLAITTILCVIGVLLIVGISRLNDAFILPFGILWTGGILYLVFVEFYKWYWK